MRVLFRHPDLVRSNKMVCSVNALTAGSLAFPCEAFRCKAFRCEVFRCKGRGGGGT